MHPQPMLTCSSVSGSSAWYQRVLGLVSGHGGDEYEMLLADDRLVLQLHEIDAHEHPHLVDESEPLGNGVAIWFETAAFDAAVARIHGTRPTCSRTSTPTRSPDIARSGSATPTATSSW